MPDARGRMSEAELRAFLAGRHLAVITTNGADGVPHSTPVWYMVEDDGSLSVIVLRNSVKLRNIERDPRISMTIAPETRPYAFARYRGTASVTYNAPGTYPLAMARRYLGDEAGRECWKSRDRRRSPWSGSATRPRTRGRTPARTALSPPHHPPKPTAASPGRRLTHR